MSTPRPIAALYARISDDKYMGEEDEGKGIRRQLDDGRKLAGLKGWDLAADPYVDNDVSAYKTNVYRPRFEDMLRDLAAGVVQGIVVVDLDRFARQPRDLERAIEIYDRALKAGQPLLFASVTGEVDLSNDMGITVARVMVAFANKASRDTARRVARKHREMADEGVRSGGHRAFGWGLPLAFDDTGTPSEFDHSMLHPDESRYLIEAIEDIEGGMKEGEIARRWNDRGITTPQKGRWTRKHVRSVLMSPRLAGWRTYKGAIAIHSKTGDRVVGYQEALIPHDRWEGLRALLVARGGKQAGRAHGGGRTSAKYLLAGLLVCRVCLDEGRKVHLAGNASKRSFGGHVYACTSGYGCGKVAITGVALEDAVTHLVFGRAAKLRGAPTGSTPWPREEELAAVKADLADLVAGLRGHTVKPGTALPLIEQWEEEIELLEAEKQEHLAGQNVLAAQAIDLETAWAATEDTAKRRALLRRYLDVVFISKSQGGKTPRGEVDLRRVEPSWVEEAAA